MTGVLLVIALCVLMLLWAGVMAGAVLGIQWVGKETDGETIHVPGRSEG